MLSTEFNNILNRKNFNKLAFSERNCTTLNNDFVKFSSIFNI